MKRMVEVGEDTPEFHLIMGKAFLQHQEYDKGFAELGKVEKVAPDLPFLHFNLGIAYEETGKNELAEQEFLKDLRIDPDLADDYYQLGKIYAQAQRIQTRRRLTRRCWSAIRSGRGRGLGWRRFTKRRGSMMRRCGRWEKR